VTPLRLCSLSTALALLACGSPPPPHIVLFSADALRADHLSLSGYPRQTSPRIDAFARGAWHFEQAITVVPKTGPSFATLFSGRHPREHGVHSNFGDLPEGLPLLAEQLKAAGYRTAGFVENPALREARGFGRGFDVYRVVPSGSRGAEQLLDAYFQWAEAGWDAPSFVWIHTLDPHGPYRPPPEYERLFVQDRWAGGDERVPPVRGAVRALKVLGAIPRYQQRGDEDRVARYVAWYDGEIRLIDDAFGRVLDDLRERGRYDDAVVVFTSDHGESLGEHDYYFEHGWYAYEPGLRIPLLLKTPGQASGRRVAAPVSNLDFFRTIAGLSGIRVPEGVGGQDLLAGALADRVILVENSGRYAEKYFGLRSSFEKYLRREGDGREELYDLVADPGELHDLAARRPERIRELRAQLEQRLAKLASRARPPVEPADDDEETLERLRALGYGE
jgi:arylsulfatase